MDSTTYERLFFLAKNCHQAERCEEAIGYMEEIIKAKKTDLSIEERNLFSLAFKNHVNLKRSGWRTIYGLEIKEKNHGGSNLKLVTPLKEALEKELSDICVRMLDLLENYLLPKAANLESKVFYMKVKADYNRYEAEFSNGAAHDKASEKAKNTYREAYELSQELDTINPIKLGLALNYSVFYYEVVNDTKKAIEIADETFNEGITKLDQINQESANESTTILQLLRDNMDMWNQDKGDQEDYN